jgi:hypothetical protein
MDSNVTRKGLLALKDSKPVPITAHSHEIIVPCVYTETVKKMMKAKGIELPLTPEKLAALRKIAKATPGKYEPDKDDKPGGTTHARGTTNVTVNITNKMVTKARPRRGRKGKGRSNIIMSRASGLAQAPLAPKGMMMNAPSFNTIRPFVANTPMGYEAKPMLTLEQAKQEIKKEDALEKRLEGLDRISETVKRIETQHRQLLDGYMVEPDSFIDERRESQIHEYMKPSSSTSSLASESDGKPEKPRGVEIEDISEETEPVQQPARPAELPPINGVESMIGDEVHRVLGAHGEGAKSYLTKLTISQLDSMLNRFNHLERLFLGRDPASNKHTKGEKITALIRITSKPRKKMGKPPVPAPDKAAAAAT